LFVLPAEPGSARFAAVELESTMEADMAMDAGRIVAGGMVAGVVMNVCDFVSNTTVLKDDMAGIAQKFGTDPAAAASLSGAVPFIIADFVLGLTVVWTYAAIRPRLGPGPKTAVLAALVMFVSISAVLWAFTTMGMMPMGAFVRGSVEALISIALGSIAGAWVYKEA
jgi:hypothetical protein